MRSDVEALEYKISLVVCVCFRFQNYTFPNTQAL